MVSAKEQEGTPRVETLLVYLSPSLLVSVALPSTDRSLKNVSSYWALTATIFASSSMIVSCCPPAVLWWFNGASSSRWRQGSGSWGLRLMQESGGSNTRGDTMWNRYSMFLHSANQIERQGYLCRHFFVYHTDVFHSRESTRNGLRHVAMLTPLAEKMADHS